MFGSSLLSGRYILILVMEYWMKDESDGMVPVGKMSKFLKYEKQLTILHRIWQKNKPKKDRE